MDRNQLGPIALERARTRLNKDFHIHFTWVIGDTPRDIHCARSLGCKVLAVGTGRYSVKALKAHKPDRVVSNLSDYSSIIRYLKNGV